MKKITPEDVERFLNGHDPMERIISIECGYDDNTASIIYVNENGDKRVKRENFYPFVWVKNSACQRMFGGDRSLFVRKLRQYGIKIKALQTQGDDGSVSSRLDEGYKFLFYSYRKMSYKVFMMFFQESGVPIYERKKKNDDAVGGSKEFMTCSPVEQFMISTGKRLFKGYDNYDDLKRTTFDLETEGLNAKYHMISQIGYRNNKSFQKIINITGNKEEKWKSEIAAIEEFVRILSEDKPDNVAGHNSENFDWDFIINRCKEHGVDFSELSAKYLNRHPIFKKKKQTVLKLGGEMEYYYPTIMWGTNIIDSMHAARRAQALDSSMKSSNLKYVTKYLGLNKQNRVYVPGDIINQTWAVTDEVYAFNDDNGDWYKVTDSKPLREGYVLKSGKYIVERYLYDDLWETDKVELKLNESNFLVGKMIPTSFSRTCTMGTAGVWKLIMLAWCYENDLAIPSTTSNRKFTGGLSRLLITGYVSRIVKLDFNSLYPSIILTWNISTSLDVMNIMLYLLEYILTQREKYKDLKNQAGSKADEIKDEIANATGLSEDEINKMLEAVRYWKAEKIGNDKKQLPLKVLGNGFFGSYGCPMVFPFGDIDAAEKTTCIGRMSLRLMISHFTNIGYTPVVGDTDGFNFQMPEEDKFRYNNEHPYISTGGGRNSVKGKAYTRVDADVAEFEDTYFTHAWNGGVNKMGLGIDEYCDACIQFARKNYADLMPDGKTKKVGNTIKSRKMSGYLEKFIDTGIDLLLHDNGYQFLENYYNYIEQIYNYQIPVRDIASKGNIKKTMEEYIADSKTLTKSGSKKSRQAWYELALKENIPVKVSDTIYYINTGVKKSQSDVKRITHQYTIINGEEVELTAKVIRQLVSPICEKQGILYKNLKTKDKKEMLKPFIKREEDEIILNCQIVPSDIINSEDDILCSEIEDLGYEPIEYNVDKYISQFNNRIRPLLVCFSPDIRNEILITNPKDRKFFTESESKLVNGFPNKPTDQDTYEALMTPERKEIEFWLKINERPPFVDECGIDWDSLVNKYYEERSQEDNETYKLENTRYLEALEKITPEDVEAFEEDGVIPSYITSIVTMGSDLHFYFNNIPDKKPSTGGYVFDDISVPQEVDVSY